MNPWWFIAGLAFGPMITLVVILCLDLRKRVEYLKENKEFMERHRRIMEESRARKSQ